MLTLFYEWRKHKMISQSWELIKCKETSIFFINSIIDNILTYLKFIIK
jgi:hypothetical protein